MSGSMGGHESAVSLTTTWLTPPHIINDLGPFDTDPCAHVNSDTAKTKYILPTDGLLESWKGMVWLNPPYGSETWIWLDRLAKHGSGIALIFARTETAGFYEQVWQKADGILFLKKRLHFHDESGKPAKGNAGAPSCLVAYGTEALQRLESSKLKGSLVNHWFNL